MPVYIDKAEKPLGRMKMCHMLADTLPELFAMADRIGLRRAWFQPLSSPHFDLSKAKRAEAVAAGAIEVDRRELAAILRRQRDAWTEEYRLARERGEPYC